MTLLPKLFLVIVVLVESFVTRHSSAFSNPPKSGRIYTIRNKISDFAGWQVDGDCGFNFEVSPDSMLHKNSMFIQFGDT